MKKRIHIIKAAAILAVIAGWVSIPYLTNKAEAGGVPIIIRSATLSAPGGAVNPHGAAEWQLYADANREIEVEVEDLSQPQGTVLTAFVDGNSIGTLTVDAVHKARLKLRTEDGQTVPVVNDGSTVQVKQGSTVLVAGVFGVAGPTPTPSVSPTGSPTGTPSPSPTGSPDENELFANLTGPTLNGVMPHGFGEFETHTNRTELDVRVSQVNLPVGTSLSVVINGNAAGNIILEAAGRGRLRLRSDNGDTVPAVIVGSTIAVKNGSSTVLSGTFAGGAGPSPSPSPSPSPALGRRFEGIMTRPNSTATYYVPSGEVKVLLNSDETQATISGEYEDLTSNQTSTKIVVTVGSTTTVIQDFGALGGRERNFGPATVNVTAVQVQQLRAGLWTGIVGTVNNPALEISGALRPESDENDFDGDGNNDLAVFRPSTAAWYTQNSTGFSATTFGGPNDKVVSGDYDGDGRTDTAVFRSVNGNAIWEVRRSSDGGISAAQFGFATDIPARGDFDGDGRFDLAVYRPSTGVWYVQKSDNTGYIIVRFGLAEDKPVPMDIDGDGRDEIAVFRPSSGDWYWIRSSDGGVGAVHWGATGDVPVRGDFDGDGQDDFTVFRPSTGVWYIAKSTDGGFVAARWGLDGDIPVAGNYDGDGKTDIAVFRPSEGNWYILRSSDGSWQAIHFGLNGDVPMIAR